MLTAVEPVSGQIELLRYRPLNIGDLWIYSEDDLAGQDPAPSIYNELEVLGDTLIVGMTYLNVRCTASSLQFKPVGVESYAVRVNDTDGSLDVIAISGGTDCSIPAIGSILGGSYTEPSTIEVSGIPYDVAGERVYSQLACPGTCFLYHHQFAADLGLVHYTQATGGTPDPPFSSGRQSLLLYAFVGGQAYGIQPVGTEPHAGGGRGLSLTSAPNPFSNLTTLTFSLDSSEGVILEVFDVLGRHLYTDDLGILSSGQHRMTLDSISHVSGIHVVRLRTYSGAVATRRVIRVD